MNVIQNNQKSILVLLATFCVLNPLSFFLPEHIDYIFIGLLFFCFVYIVYNSIKSLLDEGEQHQSDADKASSISIWQLITANKFQFYCGFILLLFGTFSYSIFAKNFNILNALKATVSLSMSYIAFFFCISFFLRIVKNKNEFYGSRPTLFCGIFLVNLAAIMISNVSG